MTHYLPPLAPPTYIVVLGLVAGLFVTLGLISKRFTKAPILERVGNALFQAGCLGTLVFLGGVMFSSGITFAYFYVPIIFDSVWAAPAAFIIGVGLFLLRKRQLPIYAGLEIGAACLTIAVCALTQYGSPSQRGIALMTAVYFLIRGLDNAERGDLFRKLNRKFTNLRVQDQAIGIVTLGCLIVGIVLSTRSETLVGLPYLSSPRGVFPVSALECGRPFVMCDEKAWREHERLETGTMEDRQQAIRIAAARQRQLRH